MAPIGPLGKDMAIINYNSKIRDKTKSGDYRIVEMNYDDDKADDKKEEK